MINAVVLLSGSGSNLQAIIDQIEAGKLPVTIKLVLSNNPDVYGLERAKKAGIETDCIDHRKFNSREEFDQALIARLDRTNPDLVILAGFMRILTSDFVKWYHNRLINIHPSLLPKYPGTQTHQRAIDSKDEWHGASVHFVVAEVDAGPIIIQGRLKIGDTDNAESLSKRVLRIEHMVYPQAIAWFAQGRLSIRDHTVLLDGETSSDQLQSFAV
jgi:phosphoribosylglycinamide formyltransferase-1